MQTVTLSEFCRIVKMDSKENKGKLSLGRMGENHGTCEETGKQHGRIPRYLGESDKLLQTEKETAAAEAGL